MTFSDGTTLDSDNPVTADKITVVGTPQEGYNNPGGLFDGETSSGDSLIFDPNQSKILFYIDVGIGKNPQTGVYKTYYNGPTDTSTFAIENGKVYGSNTVPESPEQENNWTFITTLTMTRGNN